MILEVVLMAVAAFLRSILSDLRKEDTIRKRTMSELELEATKDALAKVKEREQAAADLRDASGDELNEWMRSPDRRGEGGSR